MPNIPDRCPVDGCDQRWDISPSSPLDPVRDVAKTVARILDPMSFEEPVIGENHGRGFEPCGPGKVYCYGSGGHAVDLDEKERV